MTKAVAAIGPLTALVMVVAASAAYADAPATTTTSAAVTASELQNDMFDGAMNIFYTGLNAAFAAWPVFIAVMVPIAIAGMFIGFVWRRSRLNT